MNLVAATLAVALITWSGLLRPADNALEALRMKTLQRPASGAVVVVALDGESLRKLGTWPFSRERYAEAVRNLRAAGAGVVAFDIDFSAPSSLGGDSAFGDAIKAHAGWIVLPAFAQSQGRFHNQPLPALAENAVIGSVNIELAPDGVVRSYARGYEQGPRYYPTMGAVLANEAYGETTRSLIDYGIRAQDIDVISFDDVVNNRFDPLRVRNKNILVGATALELGDFFTTPISAATPGVFIHALGYESLVQRRAILSAGPVASIMLAAGALLLLWPHQRKGRWPLIMRHGAVVGAAVAGPFVVQAFIPLSIDVAAVILAQAACMGEEIRQELARRAAELVRQREEHLSYMAHHDAETGLPNRRAMLARVHALAGEDIVVLAAAIGIERFALLRSAVGYADATDAVRALASRLRAIDKAAEIFQFGTSTLGVLIVRPAESDLKGLVDAALDRLDRRVTVAGHDTELVIRAGLAASARRIVTPEALLEQASLSLDHARLHNRRLVRFDATVEDPKFRLALVNDVLPGLERGDFRVVYQPKASIRSGEINGAEALLRWTHPDFGPISPDRFIRIAEETGTIEPLTNWLLARVIDDQAAMRRAGFAAPVSVNVSARTLCIKRFCEAMIARILQSSANISIEITETAVMADPEAALASVSAFRRAGLRLSIDDYGAGQSSITYLKQIEATELKLDRMLAHDVAVSQRDRLVIKSTIDLAHALDMTVVCEGVEDSTSLAVLASLGCDGVQGYILAHPMGLQEFVEFVAGRAAAGADVLASTPSDILQLARPSAAFGADPSALRAGAALRREE